MQKLMGHHLVFGLPCMCLLQSVELVREMGHSKEGEGATFTCEIVRYSYTLM